MKWNTTSWKQEYFSVIIGLVGLLVGVWGGLYQLPMGLPYLTGGPLPPAFCANLTCLETTKYRVNVGDERTQVVSQLSSTAWYHGVCYESNMSAEDIFLYGGRHRDRAYLRIVHSTRSSGVLVVDQFGSFDPPQWVAYDRCLPSTLWTSDFQKPEFVSMLGGIGLILLDRRWLRRFIDTDQKRNKILQAGILFGATTLIGYGLFYLCLSLLMSIFR